jgi:hypothetical protein
MTYKEFSSHMKQLTNEKKVIVDDFLYQKLKTLQNHFLFFNRWCRDRENFHLHVHIQNMLRYYIKQITKGESTLL